MRAFFCVFILLLHKNLCVKVLHKSSDNSEGSTGSLPEEQQRYIDEQYQIFMENRRKEKQKEEEANKLRPPPEGITPSKLGMKRENVNVDTQSLVKLTPQVTITGGSFWFGSQMDIKEKIAPLKSRDGSEKRKKATVKDFSIDEDCVSNEQFKDFVESTNYVTEAELYGWSFVLEIEASDEVVKQVDGPTGYGRVKTAKHWMAVPGAYWKHPYGPDSIYPSSSATVITKLSAATTNNAAAQTGSIAYPVVHISYKDATEYCQWVGRRLPSDKEWEYASRGGLVNKSYPWGGETYQPQHNNNNNNKNDNNNNKHDNIADNDDNSKNGHRMNIWQGEFPKTNTKLDGYIGIAPLYSFTPQNSYQVFNMLGNVWEWVSGGSKDQRISRGGSYIDSIDGKFNHPVLVSTRNHNSGDSTSSTSGFRCASSTLSKRNTNDKNNQKIDSGYDNESISSSGSDNNDNVNSMKSGKESIRNKRKKDKVSKNNIINEEIESNKKKANVQSASADMKHKQHVDEDVLEL